MSIFSRFTGGSNKAGTVSMRMNAALIEALHQLAPKDLHIIGVSGSHGKTTTSFFIHRLLHESGYQTALITNTAYGFGLNLNTVFDYSSAVDPAQTAKWLEDQVNKGLQWLVLEIDNHILMQPGAQNLPLSVAVMTDFNPQVPAHYSSPEEYLKAKQKLFTLTQQNKNGMRIGIVNADDAASEQFSRLIDRPVLYGSHGGEIVATDAKITPRGSTYKAIVRSTGFNITCNLPGSFNVTNSLAAVALGRTFGLTQEQIEHGIAALDRIESLSTRLDEGQPFDVIIDPARSAEAFQQLFEDLRPIVKGRLIVMFGSAGEADEPKRLAEGLLAGQYADVVVITEEDDRSEKGQNIMERIASGAEKSGKIRETNLFLLPDRAEAIKFTLSQAQPGDTVLLLGKGNNRTVERADGTVPWNEVEQARKTLTSQ